MPTVKVPTAADRQPFDCIAKVIASVESFSGAARLNDHLMLITRNRRGASRFGQSVFLREEVDAGTIHDLVPVARGGLAILVKKMTGKPIVPLRVDEGFWLSGIPARADAADDAFLVAIDPAVIEALQSAAKSRGLTLSRVGEFRREPAHVDGRSRPMAADTVQAAFWARRRFWRQPLLV